MKIKESIHDPLPSMDASEFPATVSGTDFRMDISKWKEGQGRGTIIFTSKKQEVRIICTANGSRMTLEACDIDSSDPFITLVSDSILDGSEERTFLNLREVVQILNDGLNDFTTQCKKVFAKNYNSLLVYSDTLKRQFDDYLESIVRNMKVMFV